MSPDALPHPRRDLEYIPVEHQGQTFVLIRDRFGLVQQGKAIRADLYRFLALLESSRSLSEIQSGLMRISQGRFFSEQEILRIVQSLDESFLLDSDRFQEARQGIVDRFGAQTVRPCALSGQSYPSHPQELKEQLDRILALADQTRPVSGDPRAFVAPHIDLQAGAQSYAQAYTALGRTDPERIIVLGVGHQLTNHLFSVTRKDFQTPLGLLSADVAGVEALIEAGGSCIAPDDFEHCFEHSLEFQVLFLQHCLSADIRMIPVLCGSVMACLPEYSRQAFLDRAGGVLEVLKNVLDQGTPRTMAVAGVDLSHIGPKFGHDRSAAAMQHEAGRHDQALLEAFCAQDPEAFWKESAAVEDRYNVCGFSALAGLLEILPPGRGQVLDYRLWMEEATRSGVSFGAVVFAT